jgi:hypothetical protein
VESVNRQLVAKVVQDVVRCRRETARVGKNEVGGDKKVGEVVGGDVAGDGLVVSSGARVFQDGLVVARVNSDETKDSGAESRVGGSEVVNLDVGFGGRLDAGEVEGCGEDARSADGENSPEGERRGREHVVVRRGGRAGCCVGANVDQSAFEVTLRAFFLHLVGSRGQNLRDGAGATPEYNVLCSATGTFHLGMGGGHVYLDALSECKRCRGAL